MDNQNLLRQIRGVRVNLLMLLIAIIGPTTKGFAQSPPIGPSTGFRATTTTSNYAPDEFAGVLHQAGRQIAQVAAKTSPAVVHIESQRESRSSVTEETGSGILMSDPRVEGVFVVTNRHVVADAELKNISILLSDLRVIQPYEKIEDAASDIAVLRVRDPGIAPAQWGDSDNLDIGHFVLAMGSPFGLNRSVTLGIISAKGRRALDLPGSQVINQDFLQTDAAINPGNSGGPLIDLNGRVVGINTAIASQGGGNEGIGFSIPSNLVQFVSIQLLQDGRVRRGYLGVELDQNFDLDTARRFSLDRLFGARVMRVVDGTPASQAGLQRDDIIIGFDGMDVADENDLINRVSLTPVNKQVQMIVVRGGRRVALSVTLAERNVTAVQPRLQIPGPQPPILRNSGLETTRLIPEVASQLGLENSKSGLLVTQVPEGSSLKLYDVIDEVARRPVETPEQFEEILRHLDSANVLLKVRRLDERGATVEKLVVLPRVRESRRD